MSLNNNINGILLVGKMGAGKTTVMESIRSNYGYTKHSMATWLKDTIQSHYRLKEIRKNDKIKIGDKELTVRRVLQLFGTEVIRNFDPQWHVDEVINRINTIGGWPIQTYKFIIDDIRFLNEVEGLTNQFKCVTIRVDSNERKRVERICLRDGLVPTPEQLSHKSETETDLIKCDHIINNNGSLNELHNEIKEVMNRVNETNS